MNGTYVLQNLKLLYCILLYLIILYCSLLNSLYCIVLYCIVLYSVLCCIALFSILWQFIIIIRNIYTLRLLLIAGTNFSEFSGNQQNR